MVILVGDEHSNPRLIAFNIGLIPLGNVEIQSFFLPALRKL